MSYPKTEKKPKGYSYLVCSFCHKRGGTLVKAFKQIRDSAYLHPQCLGPWWHGLVQRQVEDDRQRDT